MVKPAENDSFYGMDAYGCKETWATVDTLLYVMCVVCFINIIKQKHIICRRKFLRFSIFKSKFLKGCSLKIPYMYASIYQTNREKWNIVWHLIVNPCTSYIIKPWSTFLSCLYITSNHVKFLLRQGRDKHMHNDVHIFGMQAHIWIRWRRRRKLFWDIQLFLISVRSLLSHSRCCILLENKPSASHDTWGCQSDVVMYTRLLACDQASVVI